MTRKRIVSERIDRMRNDKMRRMCRRGLAGLLICGMLWSLAACKKETPAESGDGGQTTPVTEAVTAGFAEANAALVKQRAEENAKTTAPEQHIIFS